MDNKTEADEEEDFVPRLVRDPRRRAKDGQIPYASIRGTDILRNGIWKALKIEKVETMLERGEGEESERRANGWKRDEG
uniref:Uncharacterized protein n=1 Tax=Pristionchus pacificus TaxID=54126 RepID=A0A2A6CGS8_PRIPA